MDPTTFVISFTILLIALFATFLGLTQRMLLREPGSDADSDPSANRLLIWFAAILFAIVGVTIWFLVSTIGLHPCALLAWYAAAFGGVFVLIVGFAFFARGLNQLTSGELAQVRLIRDLYVTVLRPAWQTGRVPWELDAVGLSAIAAILLGQLPRIAPRSPLNAPVHEAWLDLMVVLIWIGTVAVFAGILWTVLAEGSWLPSVGTDVRPGDPQYLWRLALRRGFYPASGAGTSKVLPFPLAELREQWRTGGWRQQPHWQRGLLMGFGLLATLCGTIGFWRARRLAPAIVLAVLIAYAIVRLRMTVASIDPTTQPVEHEGRRP